MIKLSKEEKRQFVEKFLESEKKFKSYKFKKNLIRGIGAFFFAGIIATLASSFHLSLFNPLITSLVALPVTLIGVFVSVKMLSKLDKKMTEIINNSGFTQENYDELVLSGEFAKIKNVILKSKLNKMQYSTLEVEENKLEVQKSDKNIEITKNVEELTK